MANNITVVPGIVVPPITTQLPAASSAADADQLDKDVDYFSALGRSLIKLLANSDPAAQTEAKEALRTLVFDPNGPPRLNQYIAHLQELRTRTMQRQAVIDQLKAANEVLSQQNTSLRQQLQVAPVPSRPSRLPEPSTTATNPDGHIIPAPGTSVTTTTTTEKTGMGTGTIVAALVAVAAAGGAVWWYTEEQKKGRRGGARENPVDTISSGDRVRINSRGSSFVGYVQRARYLGDRHGWDITGVVEKSGQSFRWSETEHGGSVKIL